MPDDARRDTAFYDHENEPRRHVVDWGADDLFTRMPRRRTVHTPPPPRARRPAPIDPAHRPGPDAAGRFERLDGEAPSAGDVLPSSGRFARPPIQDGPRAEPPADGGFAFPDRGSRPGDDSASERRPTSSGGSGLRATGSSGRTAPANGDPAG